MLYTKEDKLLSPSYFTAKDFLSLKNIKLSLPKTVILIPIANISAYLKGASKKRYNLFGDIDIINDNLAVVSNFGMGAPMAAMMTEVLAALGVKHFILLGIAGGLNPALKIGQSVICQGALCDEGTSKDYINKEYVAADKDLLTALHQTLACDAQGTTWTTDSIFRETKAEIAFYQKQNIQTVEMEAAAVFAVCESKGLKAAGVFVISDILSSDEDWKPGFNDKNIYKKITEHIASLANAWQKLSLK